MKNKSKCSRSMIVGLLLLVCGCLACVLVFISTSSILFKASVSLETELHMLEALVLKSILSNSSSPNTSQTNHVSDESLKNDLEIPPLFWSSTFRFYILEIPEYTSQILALDNESQIFYTRKSVLNEYAAEVWLHRGFQNFQSARTMDAAQADVILIPAYLHFWKRNKIANFGKGHNKNTTSITNPTDMELDEYLMSKIQFPSKPHVLLVPSTNPIESRKLGIQGIVKKLYNKAQVNLFSVAFERNKFWQHLEPERMIPIPYVVRMNQIDEEENRASLNESHSRNDKISNYVFYSGNARKNAWGWAGCNRSMILPLADRTDMYVQLIGQNKKNRASSLSQADYNSKMQQADYCLILCGDTVTSRSLASSMVAGCIPIRVGSRLRGYCDTPCKKGWGWTITNGLAHLPYNDSIPWDLFPEVDEAQFTADPYNTLRQQVFDVYNQSQKDHLRSIMRLVRPGFLYGTGNPVNSNDFGGVAPFVWKSIVSHLLSGGHL